MLKVQVDSNGAGPNACIAVPLEDMTYIYITLDTEVLCGASDVELPVPERGSDDIVFTNRFISDPLSFIASLTNLATSGFSNGRPLLCVCLWPPT